VRYFIYTASIMCGIERERLPNALFVFGKALTTE
jgi:hypothetical protein